MRATVSWLCGMGDWAMEKTVLLKLMIQRRPSAQEARTFPCPRQRTYLLSLCPTSATAARKQSFETGEKKQQELRAIIYNRRPLPNTCSRAKRLVFQRGTWTAAASQNGLYPGQDCSGRPGDVSTLREKELSPRAGVACPTSRSTVTWPYMQVNLSIY